MAETKENRIEAEVRQHILQLLKVGTIPYDELVEAVLDFFVDEHDEEPLTECANRLVPLLYDTFVEEQSMWPKETDCDRLDKAFAVLENEGIVARQDFTCCQTCGHSEIWDEITEATKTKKVLGYTFYHHQDLEWIVEIGECLLAFGATSENENDALRVGEIICKTLRKEGFNVQWDGSLNTRILIKDIDWKMRLAPRS